MRFEGHAKIPKIGSDSSVKYHQLVGVYHPFKMIYSNQMSRSWQKSIYKKTVQTQPIVHSFFPPNCSPTCRDTPLSKWLVKGCFNPFTTRLTGGHGLRLHVQYNAAIPVRHEVTGACLWVTIFYRTTLAQVIKHTPGTIDLQFELIKILDQESAK